MKNILSTKKKQVLGDEWKEKLFYNISRLDFDQFHAMTKNLLYFFLWFHFHNNADQRPVVISFDNKTEQ